MYIPVAVDAYYFKDAMQNKVNLAARRATITAGLADQVSKSKTEFHVPDDAVITPTQNEGRVQCRVQFSRRFHFRVHLQYDFDYTAAEHQFS
jgi:hypothetical protein